MHREHKDFRIRYCLSDLTDCFDPVPFGHTDIDQGHIRFQLSSLFHCLMAMCCFTDDSPTTLGPENRSRTAPHQGVVVSYQNAKSFHDRLLREVSSRLLWCRDYWNQYEAARQSA